jgi:hypothetical protein
MYQPEPSYTRIELIGGLKSQSTNLAYRVYCVNLVMLELVLSELLQ